MMIKDLRNGTGQRLYERAKAILPGGAQLLGKRAEMYLPELWPAYYSHASGCEVWDLDGRRYTDFTMVGIGTTAAYCFLRGKWTDFSGLACAL